jgi:hypothetical protein
MKRAEWIAHGCLRLSHQITHSLTRYPLRFHGARDLPDMLVETGHWIAE